MLRDVKNFVKSRTDLGNDAVLREINLAWTELWASQDLPNSLFEMTVVPDSSVQRVSLPWYVGTMRAVKSNCARERVILNTPRPYYQDQTYGQSPYTWAIMGTNSCNKTITNATTLGISVASAEVTRFTVTIKGPTDNAQSTREQIIFNIGDTTHETVNRFLSAEISKDSITKSNVVVRDQVAVELALIPNCDFIAINTIVQLLDKCATSCCAATGCNCFDILYKARTPYLFYDETYIPHEEALMAKVMEWITMSKEGQEQRAQVYANKANQLETVFNGDQRSIEKRLDIARGTFNTAYPWSI